MPKFTLTCEHDGPVGSTNTLQFEADYLPTVLEHFRQFLKGCSFEFDGELEIVEVDYSYRGPEPDYDDEYEEDSDVGEQVFDTMVSSLSGQPQSISNNDHYYPSTTYSSKIVSPNPEICSVCGLSKKIMERNPCYDPKCGIKK
jgi:hypothetical protein